MGLLTAYKLARSQGTGNICQKHTTSSEKFELFIFQICSSQTVRENWRWLWIRISGLTIKAHPLLWCQFLFTQNTLPCKVTESQSVQSAEDKTISPSKYKLLKLNNDKLKVAASEIKLGWNSTYHWPYPKCSSQFNCHY